MIKPAFLCLICIDTCLACVLFHQQHSPEGLKPTKYDLYFVFVFLIVIVKHYNSQQVNTKLWSEVFKSYRFNIVHFTYTWSDLIDDLDSCKKQYQCTVMTGLIHRSVRFLRCVYFWVVLDLQTNFNIRQKKKKTLGKYKMYIFKWWYHVNKQLLSCHNLKKRIINKVIDI